MQKRPLRKRFQYRLEFVAMRALVAAASVAPPSLLRGVGSALGVFAYRVVRVRKQIVNDNISRSLALTDKNVVDRIALRSYRNFGRSIMEMVAFKRLREQDVAQTVSIDGACHLDDALAKGKGAILFTGHFGNWELLGAAVAQSGYPLHVTDTNHSNKHVHNLISDLRRAQRVQIIEPNKPVQHLLKLLSQNQFIAYLADQNARAAGVFVDFFDRPAWTLRSPAVLALRAGSPIVPCFLIRKDAGHHHAVFCKPLWPQRGLNIEDAVVELTQRYTHQLEEYIRKYPDMYFWTHRRWKTQPDANGRPLKS